MPTTSSKCGRIPGIHGSGADAVDTDSLLRERRAAFRDVKVHRLLRQHVRIGVAEVLVEPRGRRGEAEIVYDFVQVGDLELPPLARDRRDASHDTTARHERNDQLGEVAQTDEVASPDVGGRERLWHAGAIHKHVHRSADRRDRMLDRGRVTQIGLFETGDGQVGLVQVEGMDLRPELDERRRRRRAPMPDAAPVTSARLPSKRS